MIGTSGGAAIPGLMTAVARGMAIDAAVGDKVQQIKEAAAIVGGMTILSQAVYDS